MLTFLVKKRKMKLCGVYFLKKNLSQISSLATFTTGYIYCYIMHGFLIHTSFYGEKNSFFFLFREYSEFTVDSIRHETHSVSGRSRLEISVSKLPPWEYSFDVFPWNKPAYFVFHFLSIQRDPVVCLKNKQTKKTIPFTP